MPEEITEEGIEHLEKIESQLEQIKDRTGYGPWAALRNGVFQGAGAVVGSILAVILIGWLLSLFGVLPGFKEIGQLLQNAFDQIHPSIK